MDVWLNKERTTTTSKGPSKIPRNPNILKPINIAINVVREESPTLLPITLGSIIRRTKNKTMVNTTSAIAKI